MTLSELIFILIFLGSVISLLLSPFLRRTGVECPANSVPAGVRQTGMEGALNGTRKAAQS
jgi:hypothetical protein